MPEPRFPLIAILLVLIATFTIYGIILLPGYTFAGMDFLNLTFPRTVLARDAVWAGYIPLWNWYEWGGVPLLATSLGALCYPLTWLAAAVPLPYGLQFFVFTHMIVAGIGAWLLSRRALRLQAIPATYTAIVYAGNAFFTGRLEQSQVIAANVLLPWLLLATWRAVFFRKAERPWVAVVWALTLLAGHPQFAMFNIIGCVAVVGLLSLILPRRSHHSIGELLGRWWRVAWQLVLGTALAAVQLLPTWELGRLSERIWPYTRPTIPQLAWDNLPALIVPRYYNLITGEVGRVMGYTELGLYAGILTLPFALAAICWALFSRRSLTVKRSRGRRRGVLVIALAWFVAMIFALGDHTGLASFVYDKIPFFKQSRGAARSLNVAALMLALLSGHGLQLLVSAAARRRKMHSTSKNEAVSRHKYRAVIATTICIFTIVDLAFAHLPTIRSILVPVVALKAKPLMPDNVRSSLQAETARAYRFMSFDSDLYLNNSAPAVAERFSRLQPNLNSLSRIALTDGYEEGLLPLRARANLFRRYNRNLRGPSPDASLLAALGANLLFTEYPLTPDATVWQPVSPAYSRSQVVPSLAPSIEPAYQWWRSSYPAARVYSLVDLLPDDTSSRDFLARLKGDFPLFNQTKSPTSLDKRSHAFSDIYPEAFTSAADNFRNVSTFSDWNQLSFVVQTNTSAALVMLSPYPGWKISENNVKNPDIKALNSLSYLMEFRSSTSPPYPVHFIFAPFSFRLGLFITLIACITLISEVLPRRPKKQYQHKF